jgi:hypothetical protein
MSFGLFTAYEGRSRPFRKGSTDVSMAIVRLRRHSDKQVAFADTAAIYGNAGYRALAAVHQRSARYGSDLFRGIRIHESALTFLFYLA